MEPSEPPLDMLLLTDHCMLQTEVHNQPQVYLHMRQILLGRAN